MSSVAAPLVLSGIRHSYKEGEGALEVLRGVNLTVASGEIVALIGIMELACSFAQVFDLAVD